MKEKRLVLITGASTGIGFEAAKYLSLNGFTVLAGVRTDKDYERLNSINKEIIAIKIDVTDELTIDSAVVKIRESYSFQNYFALINNAGIVKAGPLEFIKIEDLQIQLEVNVTSQVRVTQKFLPLLRESKKARVLFTGSNSGVFTIPMNAPYCASKHAIEAIADGFRRELLANSTIKVSLLQPGQIKTPIWEKSLHKATQAKKSYPPQVDTLYGHLTNKIENQVMATAHKNAADPFVVSRAILHALDSEKPRTRYSMGTGSRLTQLLFKRLPDKMMDLFLRKFIGY
jgi:NAD(P)-dependent dehydrogenase (short-subunit alcohol dehydrogenase family)